MIGKTTQVTGDPMVHSLNSRNVRTERATRRAAMMVCLLATGFFAAVSGSVASQEQSVRLQCEGRFDIQPLKQIPFEGLILEINGKNVTISGSLGRRFDAVYEITEETAAVKYFTVPKGGNLGGNLNRYSGALFLFSLKNEDVGLGSCRPAKALF